MKNLVVTICIGLVLAVGLSEAGMYEAQSSYDSANNPQLVIHSFLHSDKYDKTIRPGEPFGIPTIIALDIQLVRIGSFQEAEMEYEATMYFRQTWIDERLADSNREGKLPLGPAMFDQIWVPDTFFSNEKRAFLHDITVPNRLIIVQPDGTILYSQKITAVFGCEFKLHKFPHDNQTCKMVIESYGYHTKDITYKWKDIPNPIQRDPKLILPEFQLTDTTVHDCTAVYVSGSFSCKFAKLHLARDMSYYITRIFLPTVLIVGLSWVSFYIDYNSVPARITLGLLTVLTITTQSSSITARLPAVSYLKAVDVWMTVCMVFVFGALLEYSVVNVLARKERTDEITKRRRESIASARPVDLEDLKDPDDQSVSLPTDACCEAIIKTIFKGNLSARQVETFAKYFFPGIFLVFNICYWSIYYGMNVEA